MKWEKALLYSKVESGKDALKNPIYEDKLLCEFSGRFTSWSIEEISNLGNTFTACHRKLLTRIKINSITIKQSTVKINNMTYQVIDCKVLKGAWTILTLKAAKV